MKGAALLTPLTVRTVRDYVDDKYAPIPSERRAEIIADALCRMVQGHLPELPPPAKGEVARRLIRECVIGGNGSILPEDVVQVLASPGLQELLTEGLLDGGIADWINRHSPDEWTRRRLLAQFKSAAGSGDVPAFPMGTVEQAAIGAAHAQAAAATEPPTGHGQRWPLRGRGVTAKVPVALLLLTLMTGTAAGAWAIRLNQPQAAPLLAEYAQAPLPVRPSTPPVQADQGMPEEWRYAEFAAEPVKAYLESRNSLLQEEPYFGAIVRSARKYDVHPLLLLAITGQEQGFVPRDHRSAKEIANNPFNVFHSWREYNTTIEDSADIAAKLLAKLGNSRPEGEEPFQWLNKTYAEDPDWWRGVSQLFAKLTSLSTDTP